MAGHFWISGFAAFSTIVIYDKGGMWPATLVMAVAFFVVGVFEIRISTKETL